MDFLKAEIERKRKQKEELQKKVLKPNGEASNMDDGAEPPQKKKYIKKGDIEKIKEQQQREEMLKKKQEQVTTDGSKGEGDQGKEDEKSGNQGKKEDSMPYLPAEEVIRRLRRRGEPITLFGEDDNARAARLHKLEEREPLDYIAEGAQDDFGRSLRELNTGVEEKKEEEEDAVPDSKVPELIDESQANPKDFKFKEDFVLFVLRRLLKIWNNTLLDRTEIQRRSTQGKLETATYKQCKRYIKPLFKQLKSKSLGQDLLVFIHEICQRLEEREYVKAHDTYLRMAIGNAPWPMGVTMVGIHERSGREKIFSSHVAHVLNDETQRKFIQSLKRLMTFCQKHFVTDPSKTVG